MRYRLQRHDGIDCSATMVPITVLRMVPIQRYRHLIRSYQERCAKLQVELNHYTIDEVMDYLDGEYQKQQIIDFIQFSAYSGGYPFSISGDIRSVPS